VRGPDKNEHLRGRKRVRPHVARCFSQCGLGVSCSRWTRKFQLSRASNRSTRQPATEHFPALLICAEHAFLSALMPFSVRSLRRRAERSANWGDGPAPQCAHRSRTDAGGLPTQNPPALCALVLDKCQQFPVDQVGHHRAHPVRATRNDFQCPLLQQLHRFSRRVIDGNDLIIVAVE